MVPDLLPLSSKNLRVNGDNLIGWDNPDTEPHDLGDSDLTLFTRGPRTVRLRPSYAYSSSYEPRVWMGTNSISYDSTLDGNQVGFTFFAQINDAATVNVFIYNTASDEYHNTTGANESWYSNWTTDFPHNGDFGSWDHLPEEIDLKTFVDNHEIQGTFSSFSFDKSPYEIDGKGFLTENKWKVVRTEWHRLPEVTLSRNIGVFIEVIYKTDGISPENASTYITYPSLTPRFGYRDNIPGVELTYRSLPDVITENDSLDATLNRPLARLVDVLTHGSDLVDKFAEKWSYIDIAGGYSDDDDTQKSLLTDPTVAPLNSLMWLSQFVSSKKELVRPTSTAWSGVPSTWTDIEELVETDDLNTIVSWEELHTYSPSFSKLIAYLRFTLTTGFVGFRAGTEQAIVETVKFFLEHNKVAWIDKNPTGTNRFSVTLYTYIGDTSDATEVGGTSKIIRAAIEISKPIGIEVKHVILADL
jgi:hypothetical protein